MVTRQAIRLLVLIATVLAFAILVPMHVADEHHGDAAESHEGEHHDEGDHTEVASANPAAPTSLDLRPVVLLCVTEALVPEARGLLVVVRTDRLHDPPDPNQAALPPAPPRAPPTLRA